MAHRLARETDSESGGFIWYGSEEWNRSDAETTSDEGSLLLNRRMYVKAGAVTAASLTASTLSGAASDSSTGATYWTDFSEGQL